LSGGLITRRKGPFTEKSRIFLRARFPQGVMGPRQYVLCRHDWNEPLFPFLEQAARSMLYYLSRLSFMPEGPPSTFGKACMTS
ncbi:hypothetical protein, partial [Akkermansia sp.]|uniref:hypothetical protein n=1 Tax=Akkermansia sp. TaxID=1872421 RepID=UPI003AADF2DA